MKQRRRRPAGRPGEEGYAMVAAVAAIAVFATLALALVQANRSSIALSSAEAGQAKAMAAADAGIAIALDRLLVRDRAGRWSIDGRTRTIQFDGSEIKIRIEDERGKVPLNLQDDETAARLMEIAGLKGERARIAAASLLDWTDDDEEARSDGAEFDFYSKFGIRPPNGPLQSIDELAQIRGFDPATVERMRPFVTVNFGRGGFDPRYAQPLAIAVMVEGGINGPEMIARRRELAGQRTAIELADAIDLAGRPLTIAVEAVRPGGISAKRRAIVELTGIEERPFIVRAFD